MAKRIYVLAGEASGDLHGAHLIREICRLSAKPVKIYGVGGDKIRDTGALEFLDLAHFHVTGITDALKRLPRYTAARKKILKSLAKVHPDVVILIDNPGFNLSLLRPIHAMGIPVVYYIAPQVWAWAPKRILKIKKYVAKVLVVFEFEKKFYEKEKIPVSFVGHPLKDLLKAETSKKNEGISIALMPGSRKGELKMLFDVLAKAAVILRGKIPNAAFYLIKAPTLPTAYYERLLGNNPAQIRLVEENAYRTMAESDLAIVCSGTATLECALLGTPLIIVNRGSFLTYLTARALIRVPYLGLPNLILGAAKFPELLQYEATPQRIAAEAENILTHKARQERMKKDLAEVSRRLGLPGASARAAEEILKFTEPANISAVRMS